MSGEELYWYGVVSAFIVGLLGLTFTKKDDCNVNQPSCVVTAMFVSLGSWISVLVLVLTEIRTRFILEK